MNSIVIFCAQYLYLFVVVLIVIAWFKSSKDVKLRFLVSVVLAGAIAYILSRIAAKLYYDPRPFVAEHIKPLISHAADNGFPSDHALLTGTLTAIAYFFNKKVAYVMGGLTIIIGIARILAKVHSPLDIGAGWVFGIIGAVASCYLINWYWQRKTQKT